MFRHRIAILSDSTWTNELKCNILIQISIYSLLYFIDSDLWLIYWKLGYRVIKG